MPAWKCDIRTVPKAPNAVERPTKKKEEKKMRQHIFIVSVSPAQRCEYSLRTSRTYGDMRNQCEKNVFVCGDSRGRRSVRGNERMFKRFNVTCWACWCNIKTSVALILLLSSERRGRERERQIEKNDWSNWITTYRGRCETRKME